MKKIFTVLLCAVSIMFAQENNIGNLVIIGGGKRPAEVLDKITELAGGEKAKFAIIPMASSVPEEVGNELLEEFTDAGVKNVVVINCDSSGADSDSVLFLMEGVTGVYFSGGDQNNLTKALLGTKLIEKIHQIYNSGGVISGTSAGAAVMSEIMITGDELLNDPDRESFSTIRAGNIKTTEGFGFVKSAIIDQHFVYRKRHNRLLSVMLENPELLGIGIDESTCIWVKSDNTFEVMGKSQVIVYDAGETEIVKNGEGWFGAKSVKMHILLSGDKYSLTKKVILK